MIARLRQQGGFGLVELLVAMGVLSVGLLGLLATYGAATDAVKRSGALATASSLADAQMELYRARTYAAVALDQASVNATDATYRADAALPGGNVVSLVTATGGCSGLPPQCVPSRAVTGADGRSYRVDTYIVYATPPGGRQVRLVTVVIRDPAQPSARPYVRLASAFDQATG